jgi:D-alanyl-D-alanine carboxypeptidase/D-alanyl-D-alanine-endopeptidase (penicillin-binding protein 4)
MFKNAFQSLFIFSIFLLSGCAACTLNPVALQNNIADMSKCLRTPTMMGVAVQSMQTEKIYYIKNASSLFMPASNLKLFTAAAALLYLGPNYQYHTTLATENNNVYLKFTGDPDLTSQQVKNLIWTLKLKGIHTIKGNFYIDNNQYNGDDLGSGWMWDDLPYCYAAPIDAIMIDHNCLIHFNTMPKDNDLADQHPYHYARELIKLSLRDEGIKLTGKILPGNADNHATVIATQSSLPCRLLVKQMLKNSDNQIANSLLKTLGVDYYHQAGNWNNGILAMQIILKQRYHIDFTQSRMVDGSGLSRYDLVTPAQTLQLLNSVYHDSLIATDFISALPIAGEDGTLKQRMTETSVNGHVRAKTGTMNGASSLSGYAYDNHHYVYAFVIFINNFVGHNRPMTDIEDSIAKFIVR